MRISDIVVESPWDTVKAAASKAADTAQQMKTGFDSGYSKMDTILSPSKWGKALSGKEKSSKGSGKSSLPDYVIRDTLSKAGSGSNLYRDDIGNLKKIYADIESGNIKTADPTSTMQIVKSAYNGKTLSKEQGQILVDLSRQF
jgi:hypothetical protein